MASHFLEQPLYDFFADVWSAETSSSPYWLPDNPSLGQCVPTSLIIQDYLGGEIIRGIVHLVNGQKDSHYWNNIGSEKLDATGYQYGSSIKDITLKDPLPVSTRDYVLENHDVCRRYELLAQKIKDKDIERFFRFLKSSPIAL